MEELKSLLAKAQQMEREQIEVVKTFKNINFLEEGVLHGIQRIVRLIEREVKRKENGE